MGDVGCGTGRNFSSILKAGSIPFGIDFSRGMLTIAQKYFRNTPFIQADLNNHLPVRPNSFHAVLCALVGEHLTDIQITFSEMFKSLKRGGRIACSVFHPEMAAAGIEANFIQRGIEYRLGAERHTILDDVGKIEEAGFKELSYREYAIDAFLAKTVPDASKSFNRPLLLIIEAFRRF